MLLRADGLFAVPAPVAPLRMRVAEAAHAEREQRLQLDHLFELPGNRRVAEQTQRRGARAAQARRPMHVRDRAREMLDPVRFLSNPSSGRMGWALAEAARDRGAQVTLIAGPVELPKP